LPFWLSDVLFQTISDCPAVVVVHPVMPSGNGSDVGVGDGLGDPLGEGLGDVAGPPPPDEPLELGLGLGVAPLFFSSS